MDGVQVYEARSRMGEKLAYRILASFAAPVSADGSPIIPSLSRLSSGDSEKTYNQQSPQEFEGVPMLMDIDVVMPIPETSRTAALQCAQILNKPYREVIHHIFAMVLILNE